MRKEILAILATAALATALLGCSPSTISASGSPDAALGAGDANFEFGYDGPIPDLPQRGAPRPPPDANRPMMMMEPACPANPQGAACSTDGGGLTCRLVVGNFMQSCFCMAGAYRCPGMMMPPARADAGAAPDARMGDAARSDASGDAPRG